MSREKVKDMYVAKPTLFGNGAKLKAYKDHIGKEMIIMTKEKYNTLKVSKKMKQEIEWIEKWANEPCPGID